MCGLRHCARPLSVTQSAEPLKNKGFTQASLCARAHTVTQFGVIATLDTRNVFVSTLLTNTLIGPDKRKVVVFGDERRKQRPESCGKAWLYSSTVLRPHSFRNHCTWARAILPVKELASSASFTASLFQENMARSFGPTVSMRTLEYSSCSALNYGAPASWSSMNSLAKEPSWMRLRWYCMRSRTCSSMQVLV